MNPDKYIEDTADRANFHIAINLNKKLYNELEPLTTKQIYNDFGIVFGQTTHDNQLDILKVKIKDKEKWLWAKLKYNL
jgi:hypothetical protein